MTGRGLGHCGNAEVVGRGYVRGLGCGMGRGMGRGMMNGRGFGPGNGRGAGWLSVGYGTGGNDAAAADMKGAIERRAAYLRSELAATEALLVKEESKGDQK